MRQQAFPNLLKTLGIPFEDCGNGQLQSPADPRKECRYSVTRGEAEKLGTASIGCRVIELGTGLGVSTVYMAYTAQLVDTVDPEPWVHKALTLPENVTQFKHVTEVYGEYEFAFIDGHHDYKSVRSDILSVLPMMVKNGAIGFHDTGFDDVSKAISEHKWRWNIKLDTPAHLAIYGV